MYPMLTKTDLIWRHGTKNDLIEMISRKLGLTTKKLKEEINNN